MGTNISVGIGTSSNKDSYKAAVEAAEMAKKECGGEPTFSIVYVDSDYKPKEVLKGINKILDKKWIGTSTDSQLVSNIGYYKGGISVLAINSPNLHFSVGYVENYKKNPKRSGEKSISRAIRGVEIDKYVDPYVQFRRVQTKAYDDIVRTPPYFILTLLAGVQIKKGIQEPGRETEFLEGIFNVTGPNVPIVGGSASSDLDKYLNKGIINVFHFADGKLLNNAAITVFVVSNLYFSVDVDHGYIESNVVALLTKMDKTGHEILEINSKPALEEYARLVGISKSELLKDPFKYTFQRPLGNIDTNGNIFIKEWMPNEDNKTMHSLMKLVPNTAVNIVNYDKKKPLDTIKNSFIAADQNVKAKNPALALIFNCCGRKPLLNDDIIKEMDSNKKKFSKVPSIGFHTFGEIGAKHNTPSQTVNQSLSTLLIYDTLLTE